MAKLTSRTQNPNNIADNDIFHIVSVADTSQSPQGSSYKDTFLRLATYLRRKGIGNWNSVDPTASNDVTQGYINGSLWYNEDNGRFFILNDNSAGAASWQWLNPPASIKGSWTPTFSNVVNGTPTVIKDAEYQIIDGVVTVRAALRFDLDGGELTGAFRFNLASAAQPSSNFAMPEDIVGGHYWSAGATFDQAISVQAVAASKEVGVDLQSTIAGDTLKFTLLFQFSL